MVDYKSRGETEIARILKKYCIDFVYEHPLLIKEKKDGDGEKLRIWYPDFWLPKYSIVIEFFGMIGNKDYDKGKKAKLKAYKSLDIDCITVTPNALKNGKLKDYLLITISRLINDKVRHFQIKRKEEYQKNKNETKNYEQKRN